MLDIAMWRTLVVFVNVHRSVGTVCSRQLVPTVVARLQLHEVLEDELCHHGAVHPRPGTESRRIRHRLDERAKCLTFAPGRANVASGRIFGARKISLGKLAGTSLFAFARRPELVTPHDS